MVGVLGTFFALQRNNVGRRFGKRKFTFFFAQLLQHANLRFLP